MATTITKAVLLAGTASVALAAQGRAQQLEGYYALDPLYFEQLDSLSGAADRATSMYVSGRELEHARTGDLKDLFSGCLLYTSPSPRDS